MIGGLWLVTHGEATALLRAWPRPSRRNLPERKRPDHFVRDDLTPMDQNRLFFPHQPDRRPEGLKQHVDTKHRRVPRESV